MLATLKLLNSYFWKTIYGPILAFVFPVVLLAILGNILRLEYVYPGLIALSMLFLGLIALPLAIMELKGSSLFKYIGSSPVNPIRFTLVAIGFYAFVAICTGIVIFFATMAIFPTKTFSSAGFKYGVLGGIFTLRGAVSFYFGCFIHLMLVIVFGLAISTFAKSPQQALTLGLMITLPSMFLSGMVLSVDVIAESPVMNWVSRLIPFRYSTGNIIIGATPIDQLGSALEYLQQTIYLRNEKDSAGNIIKVHDLNEALVTSALGSKEPYPNNMLDQLIWPFKSMFDAEVSKKILQLYPQYQVNGSLTDTTKLEAFIKTLPGVYSYTVKMSGGSTITKFTTGYETWAASGFSVGIFNIPVNTGNTTTNIGMKNGVDPTLYNLLKPKWGIMEISSDNNIFNWIENWGVRKIPSVDSLTDFVTKFFKGVNADGTLMEGGKITDRVGGPAELINNGDFRWLEIFTHQSNILYYQADRVLNILLPLTLTGLGSWYIFRNFTWSLR